MRLISDQAVKDVIIATQIEYQKSSKQNKSKLLDSLKLITKRDRKHLIRMLNEDLQDLQQAKRSGRPLAYNKSELTPHIQHLWIQRERVSPYRMKEGLKDWLPHYEKCPAHLRMQLLKMSGSTLGRYINEIRETLEVKRGISTTAPARFMKNKIPINALDAKITKPGHTQTDTVAHCGNSAAGAFISSLTVTDIASAWTSNRSVFTKKGELIKEAFQGVEKELPFKLLAINADSGSEFMNKEMLKFTNYGNRIEFTRSRPYKKNDNCYVEQKNFTHVRELSPSF